MKRFVSLLLASVLCALMLAGSASAVHSSLLDSGTADVPKMTKHEIKDLLDRTEFSTNAGIWSTAPNLTEPHEVGGLTWDIQNRATARLNALRQIAGVSSVMLDTGLSETSQYGAVVQALNGKLDHYPDHPEGLPDAIYNRGYLASRASNLAAGAKFNEVVDILMTDGAARNIATVGHRRWQLNPTMTRVGFGYAENPRTSYDRFTAEYVIDMQGKRPVFNFIAWPASGNFPNDTLAFEYDTPWSITLNRDIYAVPNVRDLTVRLTRISDNYTWEFDGEDTYYTSDYGTYFNLDTGNYGGGFAIIFRPDSIYKYEGLYEVQVSGLRSVSGHRVDLRYQVDFFDSSELGEPTVPVIPNVPTVTGFSDVTRDHWAYNYVMRAAGDGAVQGVGGGRYSPDNTVTGYEFAAILLRGLFPQYIEAGSPYNPWYYQIDAAANRAGLWYGLDSIEKSAPLTRYQMSAMIYNALSALGVPRKDATLCPEIYSGVHDWDIIPGAWEDAVVTCLHYKVLNGVGGGRFDGNSNMTRAQAATVYCRVKDLFG